MLKKKSASIRTEKVIWDSDTSAHKSQIIFESFVYYHNYLTSSLWDIKVMKVFSTTCIVILFCQYLASTRRCHYFMVQPSPSAPWLHSVYLRLPPTPLPSEGKQLCLSGWEFSRSFHMRFVPFRFTQSLQSKSFWQLIALPIIYRI